MPVSLGMPSAPPPVLAPRRQTRQIQVGSVGVGSDHQVSVQSMTTTPTHDINATLQQIAELTAAGCDIVRVACPRQVRFIAKRELFDESTWAKRLLARGLRALGPLSVDRRPGQSAQEAMDNSLGVLESGEGFGIFPEGTRSKDGRMRDFKMGAAALSQSLEVPVLPVALIGAHEAMPKGSSWPRWGRPPVVVALGEPLRHRPNESVPSFNERIQATVRALYAQNRPLIEDPDSD